MPQSEPLLQPLARWSVSEDLTDIATELSGEVAMAALDWFGALAAGDDEPASDNYRSYHRLADSGGRSLAEHAFTLGALSHLAEVDDGHRDSMIHAGIVTFAPLLAIARQRSLTLDTVRRAVVAGYEAAVRVGTAFGPEHYRHFHITATAGSFGAAAASAVALGLDARGCVAAFGHAGSQAMGLWQFMDDGAEAAKAANPGFAARNGIAGALLALAGVPAATRIIEGPRGLAFALKSEFDPAPLAAPFSADGTALAGRTVKAWPVCGQMHHVLDAVRDRHAIAPIDVSAIRSITVESFEALKRIADLRHPATPAQARFSTSWCLAHQLLYGGPDFGTLRDPKVLDDPAIAALAERIGLTVSDDFTKPYPRTRSCRIRIDMADGSRSEWVHTGRRGDPERPFTPDEMQARFADLAANKPAPWRETALAVCHLISNGPADTILPSEYLERLLDV
ncbi:hypothetical protein GCM10007989_34380 [Devosia pacifica]|uniref:2-methylcitrate dehydratase PrpD n=1 Tax=Devosia pacifica TaxID=1335967 RepID=A0A918SDI1_9HYPH|nr:MmgE/PrpD family protein [Devosia pacifica]GHA35540.1 hypothetical protein GCM10007989_34380 [Devosia pacifica]